MRGRGRDTGRCYSRGVKIGAARLTFHLPENGSLRGKRRVAQALASRLDFDARATDFLRPPVDTEPQDPDSPRPYSPAPETRGTATPSGQRSARAVPVAYPLLPNPATSSTVWGSTDTVDG